MARKTKEEAEKTRQALLASAFKVFSEKGFARTTLQDIAEDAGVTRGAVYWHFKNKIDLFEKLLDFAFHPVKEIIFAKFGEDIEPKVKLIELTKVWLYHAQCDPNFRAAFSIIFNKTEWSEDLIPFKTKFREVELEFIKTSEKIFEQGINDGSLKADLDPKVAAANYFSTLFGLAQYSLFFPDEVDINEKIDSFIKILLYSYS